MKVLIVGSCKVPQSTGEFRSFARVCRLLGENLANAGYTIVAGSPDAKTADYHVLAGAARARRKANIILLRPTLCDEDDALENELATLDVERRFVRGKWNDIRESQVKAADVVLIIGGGSGTKDVVRLAASLDKPLIPITAFGGVARDVWPEYKGKLKKCGLSAETLETLEHGVQAELVVDSLKQIVAGWGDRNSLQGDEKGLAHSEGDAREYLLQIGNLKSLLIERSRNGFPSEKDYAKLRSELLSNPVIRDALPAFVLKCRTLQDFWVFIQPKFAKWKERTGFLEQEFDPLLTALEQGVSPTSQRMRIVPAPQSSVPRPDVLLVTVNEHETRAVLDEFNHATGQATTPVPLDGRVYHNLGTINSTTVYHALSEMGSGGVGAMQQTVEKAIRALDPGALIAVGVAFGVNNKKQAIGDILVSRQLRPYDVQRVGGEIILRGDKPHATARLINYFVGFAQTIWKGPKVRPGVILSGEKLIDDIDYRNSLLSFETEAVGGEMEGTGLYVPCCEHKVDWVIVKAICDWADGNKAKNKTARQKKAAKNAVQFIIQALQNSPLKHQG